MSPDTDMCLPTLLAEGALVSSQDDGYRFQGHVDFYGYNALAQGWFFGGWLAHPWPADDRPEGVTAHFAGRKPLGPGALVFYRRPRVEAFGIGFVAFVRAELADGGSLVD